MDFQDLKAKITINTKAVIIVHFCGLVHPEIRNIKDFLKEKEISEDEESQGEEEIQKLTDMYVEKVDSTFAIKEKELLDF